MVPYVYVYIHRICMYLNIFKYAVYLCIFTCGVLTCINLHVEEKYKILDTFSWPENNSRFNLHLKKL
jgi:hypothetical protein